MKSEMSTTEEKVVNKAEFTLPKRKVKLKPIRRKGGWLAPGHEASFLFKGAYYEMTVATDERNRIINPLTRAEQEFFEDSARSGMDFRPGDLNPTKREDNYWLSKKARIRLKDEITILDLANAEDYLLYKMLLTCKDVIAPNADMQYSKGTYKFAIVDENHEVQEEVSKADARMEAYTELGAIRKDAKKLRHVLMVMTGKKVARNSELEFLFSEVGKEIEKDPAKFVRTVQDKDLAAKILIEEAIIARAVKREGTTYLLSSGDKMGDNLSEAIEFLKSKKNQEHRVLIENRVEQFMSDD
jgi:hypothetical protein